MNAAIENLKNQGLIAEEKIGFDQIAKHISRAHCDLKVANANFNIDTEAAYNYAYLSMLRSSRALMFSFGYRPIDGQQHKSVVIFSEAILGEAFFQLIAKFDRMRKFRNKFTYDEPGILVSEKQTGEAIATAKSFVNRITEIIQKKSPQEQLL